MQVILYSLQPFQVEHKLRHSGPWHMGQRYAFMMQEWYAVEPQRDLTSSYKLIAC